MNRARNQFLSGTALALDQHRMHTRGDLPDRPPQLRHRRRFADHRFERGLRLHGAASYIASACYPDWFLRGI
jgi:hypothetical protein